MCSITVEVPVPRTETETIDGFTSSPISTGKVGVIGVIPVVQELPSLKNGEFLISNSSKQQFTPTNLQPQSAQHRTSTPAAWKSGQNAADVNLEIRTATLLI